MCSRNIFVSFLAIKLMTRWPFSGACFWRQKQAPVVCCRKPWHTLPANDIGRHNKDGFWLWEFLYRNSFFSYCSISWKMLSSLHFIFHLYLQTNELCYHLLRLTNHSSAFQLVFGIKLNMVYPAPVSGTRKIWCQKSMTDWPVSGTSRLVPETGTRNWPVCHHYYVVCLWM